MKRMKKDQALKVELLVEDERIEKKRSHLITVISAAVKGANVVTDDWIAVAYDIIHVFVIVCVFVTM